MGIPGGWQGLSGARGGPRGVAGEGVWAEWRGWWFEGHSGRPGACLDGTHSCGRCCQGQR